MLKVGPALTFTYRRALYGLEAVLGLYRRTWAHRPLPQVIDPLTLYPPRQSGTILRNEDDGCGFPHHQSSNCLIGTMYEQIIRLLSLSDWHSQARETLAIQGPVLQHRAFSFTRHHESL